MKNESERKGILFLTTGPMMGGAETMIIRLIENIGFDKKKLSILTIKGEGEFIRTAKKAGIHALSLNFKFFLEPVGIYRLFREIKKIRPAIVQASLFRANFWGAVLKKTGRIPVLIVSERALDLRRGYIRSKLARWADLTADKIIAVSESVRRKIIERENLKDKDVQVIYNGLPESFFCKEDNIYKREDFFTSANPLIGCLSRFSREKSVDTLIKAYRKIQKHLPGARILLVGEGPLSSELHRLVRVCGIEDKICFFGYCSNIRSLLPVLDMLVLPSLEEGFPGVLLEALACGVPCIASRIGGSLEILKEDFGDFFKPGDADDLADKVIKLYNTPEKISYAKKEGPGYIQKNFSIKKMVESYKELYVNTRMENEE